MSNDDRFGGRSTTGLGPIAGEAAPDPLAPVGETPLVSAVGPASLGPASNPQVPPPVAEDEPVLRAGAAADGALGAGGPTNWWFIGLAVLVVLIVVLAAMQFLMGGAGTAVQPGTPVSAPSVDAPVTTTPPADAPTPANVTAPAA